MPRRICRLMLLCVCTAALMGLFAFGASAFTYPSMPDDWQNVRVTVGTVTMPLERFPAGSIYDVEKRYMSVEEQKDYGFNIGYPLDLRAWECMGFARYVYSALFYKYPQDATIDLSLASGYSNSYAYRNMIEETLGTRYLDAGYSASTLKEVITACRPGAVMRVTGHSMVIMAIYDDGMLIYDANYTSRGEVSVRPYTWQSFINAMGYYDIEALHMPAYYPGFSYSAGSEPSYTLDTSTAGSYVVYDASTLTVRALPTTASRALDYLTSGDLVTVLGTYGVWAKIEYDGGAGWVHTDYIKPYQAEVQVTFDGNGGSISYTSGTYTAGEAFGSMPSGEKTNRTLTGWTDGSSTYTESSLVPAVSTLELKAKWCVLGYLDVDENAWYAANVEDAYFKGLITADSAFNPDRNATRAHMITVLGREYEREYPGEAISGSGSSIFDDVASGSYYDRYVGWAYDCGIVKGVSSDHFGPNHDVTREQIAEFLYRLAIYTKKAHREEGDLSLLDRFDDGWDTSEYARNAMCWAIEEGILQGNDKNCLNPRKSATRCQMITMFSRYIQFAGQTTVQWTEVTFDPNGGTVDQASESYVVGESFGSLPTPEKPYRRFLGWYDGDTLYTESSQVPEESLTLTAAWGVLEYTDVSENAWYVPYLEQAYDAGLVDGVGEFSALADVTRSDVVTYMARSYEWMEGITISEPSEMPFDDVELSEDYAKYVAWGKQEQLVMGVTDTRFAPDNPVTREQVAVFLYRLAGKQGKAGEADVSVLSQFGDGGSTSEYAKGAMSWAVSVGIFHGDNNGNLDPKGTTNYAEIITLMVRYMDL